MSNPLRRGLTALRSGLARASARIPPPTHDALYRRWSPEELRERPFINIGAGDFSHPYWRNVDYGSSWYAAAQRAGFVEYDLTACAPLPFETASVAIAYTSHTIEHVDDRAVANVLRECHRVLRPGGALRITCPDAELLYRTLTLGARDWWRWRARWFTGKLSDAPSLDAVTLEDYLVREVATARCRFYVHRKEAWPPERVRALADELPCDELLAALTDGLAFDPERPGDHINAWTEAKLTRALREAGFTRIYRSGRGQSLFPPMTDGDRFDRTQPTNSLYVEAIR